MYEAPIASRADCLALDEADPLRGRRALFALPEGVIYLDGNSLGPLPLSVAERVRRVVETEWGGSLIRSWNEHGWFALPAKVGDRIAALIGAAPGSVVAGDTISVNLFKLIGGALKLRPGRRAILSDDGNFPSDLYVAQGLTAFLGQGYELRMVPPEEVTASLSNDLALVMLTEVDYRTARRHDLAAVTRAAHEQGALILWDLAHSAGAFPVDLAGAQADFAVGCTYKYLNGGPGAPGFLYVRPDLQDRVVSPLSGWWGHAQPFAFDPRYHPAPGIARQQCGTQPILSLAALDAALEVWEGVDLTLLRRKSLALCSLLIARVERLCGTHGVGLAGPRDLEARGSHVSFHCREGYAVMQALIARGVIGDFRSPDLIRFGVTPLYTRFVDIWDAAEAIARVLDAGLWNTPQFLARKAVT